MEKEIEQILINGDLSKFTPEQRVTYYNRVCESLGLNPLTRPLEYITLQGRLTLYARKDCTEQLRMIHKISIESLDAKIIEGVYATTVKVCNGDGRTDVATGAVSIVGLKGDALANAIMKSETKSKRRATLSICGLGIIDETELETIPQKEIKMPERKEDKPLPKPQESTPSTPVVYVGTIKNVTKLDDKKNPVYYLIWSESGPVFYTLDEKTAKFASAIKGKNAEITYSVKDGKAWVTEIVELLS